ncbi:hypothetical protein [Aeoliella mucimassa]|uniref:hypothetical protein n=1 Tax=Aeoliella mucimassa TaxID=2527972 RepID=UPI0018D29CE1|nr:hypothetical protein [Aeoliella mucimassa]
MATLTPYCVGLVFLFALGELVQGAEFIPLGYLPGGYYSSLATNVSADGNVVVGQSHNGSAGTEAFRWTRSNGMQGLGDLPGGDTWSNASAVSGDGSVVIGRGTAGDYAGIDAFRWTDKTQMELIGYFPRDGMLFSYPGSISNDGRVIVGSSDNRAFKWTEVDGISEIPGISDLPGSSGVGGVSADGSVIVGSRDLDGLRYPYRFTEPNHVENLGLFPGSNTSTYVNGISSDGEVIIGYVDGQGWRWDESNGYQAIPSLPGSEFGTIPYDLSADGSVILGTTNAYNTDPRARFPSFIWTLERGTENLDTFLQECHQIDIAGWSLSRAYGISDDGKVIVGGGINPDGRLEAFVVDLRIPEPSTLGMTIVLVLCICTTRTQARLHRPGQQ